MLLAVDVGNTLTDLGFYEGDKLLHLYKTRSETSKSYEEYIATLTLFLKSEGIDKKQITGGIFSSVVPSLSEIWKRIFQEYFGVRPFFVGPKLSTGIKIDTDNPKEVGADLICDAVGAKEKYGPRCIICDLGTATKTILLDDKGAFAGCTIGTGLAVGLQALVHNTAVLPEVGLVTPKKVLGKNTVDSMNSAFTYGTAFELRGLADAIEKEAGYPCKRILCGGYSRYVKDLLPDFIYDETLLLDALLTLYKRNSK